MQRQTHHKEKYLNALVHAYQKIDQFHKTVVGLHISTERLFPMNEENLLEGRKAQRRQAHRHSLEVPDLTPSQCYELKINARNLHGTIHQLAKP